jgi:hypothetical protein
MQRRLVYLLALVEYGLLVAAIIVGLQVSCETNFLLSMVDIEAKGHFLMGNFALKQSSCVCVFLPKQS